GLVRIAKQPQGPGGIGEAHHSGISPIEESEGAMLLRVVKRYPLLQVGASSGELAEPEQRISLRPMCFYEEHGVLQGLSEREQLGSQLPRRLVLRPCFVE